MTIETPNKSSMIGKRDSSHKNVSKNSRRIHTPAERRRYSKKNFHGEFLDRIRRCCLQKSFKKPIRTPVSSVVFALGSLESVRAFNLSLHRDGKSKAVACLPCGRLSIRLQTRFTFPLKFKKMKQSIEQGMSNRHERNSGALLLSTPPGPLRSQGGAVFVPPELQHRWRILPHRGVQHTHEDFLGDKRTKTWLLFPPNFLESSVE